jgi:hypothetical protein
MEEPRPEEFGSTIEKFNKYENDQIMIVRLLKYVFVALAFYVIPIFLFIFYYEITNFYYEIAKAILLGTIISFLICISFYYFTVLLRLSTSIKYNKYSKSLKIYRQWKREQFEIIRGKELEKERKQEDSWKSLIGTKFEEELSIPYIGQGYTVSLSSTIRDKGVDIALTKKVNQDENSFNVGYVDDL